MPLDQDIFTVYSPITTLPPELFAKFCHFLPPIDLLTLSQTCRKFRGYLCAPNSFSTQQIWKESRLQFMPKEVMSPPVGMSEERYVELLMKERGCQICKCSEKCNVYLEFEVRYCEECFLERTVKKSILVINDKYPRKFLEIMPYAYYYNDKYHLIEQLDFAYLQYCGLSKENLQPWLDDKKHTFDYIMEYTKRRRSHEIILERDERMLDWEKRIDKLNEDIERLKEVLEKFEEKFEEKFD